MIGFRYANIVGNGGACKFLSEKLGRRAYLVAMARTIYNNSPKKITVRFKVDGVPFREDIPAFSSKTIEGMDEFSQLLNKKEREKLVKMDDGKIDEGTQTGRNIVRSSGLKTLEIFESLKSYKKEQSEDDSSSDAIRASLSSNNKIIYDALDTNEFLLVSEEEFLAVKATTGSACYGSSDAHITSHESGQWPANRYVTLGDTIFGTGSIPTGKYIIGFCFRASDDAAPQDVKLFTSGKYGAKNSLTQLGGLLSTDNDFPGGIQCFIRKAPNSTTSAKTYFSVLTTNERSTIVLNFPMTSSADAITWTPTTEFSVLQQVMAVGTKSW